jgi:hypothetical protein
MDTTTNTKPPETPEISDAQIIEWVAKFVCDINELRPTSAEDGLVHLEIVIETAVIRRLGKDHADALRLCAIHGIQNYPNG